MKFALIKVAALLVVTILVISCGEKQKTNAEVHNEESISEKGGYNEVVQISDAELQEFGIELATAGPGKLAIHVSLPGEIIIPPDNLAHIHPRFAGIVKEVRKHIGDKVRKGDVLAVIESNESLAEYQIKSLIDGTVVEKHFSLGEVVEGTDHGFVVANLSQVWAMLTLYQKDLPFVKTGQEVTISLGSEMEKSVGKIAYISPIIDEITRTAKARIILNNRKGYWKPGLFVTGSIATSESEVDVVIPKTALETFEGKTVVFVKNDEGFEPREVIIGKTNHLNVEAISGIKSGDIFVSKGGFTLKSELQKGEMGEGHGH
ncbi:MAG: HlyD family efflux transporter periplasmic adaptor subunit [Calditrichaeota bacterium]|nr:MAG: HlyD family efflux transporter periplasmic adaptor subunit [Calditrichota bacterium]MBL1207171.1 HlyD family efflux transporter periplasmic adaptor subunit [Calditrichota bacterium]NOG47003.1 HlyD family efflux transporter periplasmic adaptor subunit [Calditrichota bacterium]